MTIKKFSITLDFGNLAMYTDDTLTSKDINGMEMKGDETEFTLRFLDSNGIESPCIIRFTETSVSYDIDNSYKKVYLDKYLQNPIPKLRKEGITIAGMLQFEKRYLFDKSLPAGWCKQIYAVLKEKAVDVSDKGLLFQDDTQDSIDWIVLEQNEF